MQQIAETSRLRGGGGRERQRKRGRGERKMDRQAKTHRYRHTDTDHSSHLDLKRTISYLNSVLMKIHPEVSFYCSDVPFVHSIP